MSTTPLTSNEHGQRLLAEHSSKEMLRFITCGSVDDGKSTLIGRLLMEAGAIYDDQIAALQQDSEKHGTTGGEIDTALLLDGLEDERQQGITIDVAYRYFTTAKRKFIIADTPGHEQFTRNMVTGASTANLALILVDASKGLLTQTKRHAFIASLLGIKHAVLVVNKMDLVDYEQSTFEHICQAFRNFAAKLELPDVRFVPISALKGDNVVQPSSNMLWHEGGSLLHMLEHVYIGGDENLRDLRFPVQWVNRPNADFRGFSGTVASGCLRVGEEVTVLPSRKTTTVERIVAMGSDLSEASASKSVTVTLKDEIDVTRGDMLVRRDNQPYVRREADAMLVWMSEQPLASGKQYWIKHTSHRTSGEVGDVLYSMDVNTLHRLPATTLQLNEVGRCRLSFHDPLMFDPYRRNRHTGSFIMVDRISNETVAAGMFLDPEMDVEEEHWETEPSRRLQRVESRVAMQQRSAKYGHAPFTVLITGLSGAGKTAIATKLEQQLFDSDHKCVVLDGQAMRFGISRDLGFSAVERSENLRRAAEISKMLNDSGLVCIAAFVAPHADVRDRMRDVVGHDRMVHVHLTTSIETCRQRDTSGRYVAADEGKIADFPGVTSPYEQPDQADLMIDTEDNSVDAAVDQIINLLETRS